MSAPRVDRLTSPPILGAFYLVPTIRVRWFRWLADWPVIGPEHNDAEFFDFEDQHYHVDARFLRKWPMNDRREWGDVDTLSHPLHAARGKSLPRPVWRRRKCQRLKTHPAWSGPAGSPLHDLHIAHVGMQCARGKGGWVCPHKKASLGSILPIDGIIVCPLHGLRINAETGVVLPPRGHRA